MYGLLPFIYEPTDIPNHVHCQAMDSEDDGHYSSDKELNLLLLLVIIRRKKNNMGGLHNFFV